MPKSAKYTSYLRNMWLILGAWLLRMLIAVHFFTLRKRFYGAESFALAAVELHNNPNAPNIILAVWHEHLLLLPAIIKKCAYPQNYAVLISKSRDGDLPARLCMTYGDHVVPIRVGHRSRHVALREAMHALTKKNIIVITPDGPRGPRRQIKEGLRFLAHHGHAQIFPLTWHASWTIRLKSWDQFAIPLPFSRITITFASPCGATTSIEALDQALTGISHTP